MVARLAPETLSRRLRGWLAIAILPLGLAVYIVLMIEAAPARPDTPIAATITGFGLRERDPTGGPSRLAVTLRTSDGTYLTLDGYGAVARCRVGQNIRVFRTETASGFERWSLPDAPCG